MRRIAALLAAAAVVAVGLSTAPAQAYDSRYQGGGYGWHDHGWNQHQWRGNDWRAHHRWYPRYGYGYYR